MDNNEYDVAVIGAGAAGVTAAAAAAAGSLRVILIDRANYLGGSVTAAMHRSLCGLYSHAPKSPLDTLNEGAQRHIVARMFHAQPASVIPRELGKAWVLEFPPQAWKQALAELCNHPNLHLNLESEVSTIHREGNRITEIQLASPTPSRIQVKTLIDCTGGGIALQMIGEDVLLPLDQSDRPTLFGFGIRFIKLTGDTELLRLKIPYVLASAVDAGTLPRSARFTSFYPGPGEGQGVCKLAIDPAQSSPDEVERLADGVIEHLTKELPEFGQAQVVEKSPRALPRDGRHLRGKCVVTEHDILHAKKHGPDSVHAWWPLERWDVQTGPTYEYPPIGDHYDIPTDALRSSVMKNLLAAGTCLSATVAAAASTRAAGICLATGHAAGRLAIKLCNDRY